MVVISAMLEGISSSRVASVDTQVDPSALEARFAHEFTSPTLLMRKTTCRSHLHLTILHLHVLAMAYMLTTCILTDR